MGIKYKMPDFDQFDCQMQIKLQDAHLKLKRQALEDMKDHIPVRTGFLKSQTIAQNEALEKTPWFVVAAGPYGVYVHNRRRWWDVVRNDHLDEWVKLVKKEINK